MTQITYKSVTGGQTFGDAGSIFKDASASLNQAIKGAKSTFDQVREGAIDAKKVRTDAALTDVAGLTEQTALDSALANYATPDAIKNEYGDVDTTAVTKALQGQQDTVYSKQAEAFKREAAKTARDNAAATQADLERTRKQDNEILIATQNTVGKTSNEIRASITPDTPLHVAEALHAQADKAFTRKKTTSVQEKEDFVLATTSGLKAVDPTGSSLSYEAKRDEFNKAMEKVRATGKYTPTELNTLKRETGNALGISPDIGLTKLFDSITDSATGNIDNDYVVKNKDGELGFSFSKFSKEAIRQGYKREDITKFKAVVDNFTGETQRRAEDKRQQLRSETMDDFRAKEEYKALLKNEDPQRIKEITDLLDDSDDWLGFSDSSKIEAIKRFAEARQEGVAVSVIMDALGRSIGGEDDFEDGDWATNLNEAKLKAGIKDKTKATSTTTTTTRGRTGYSNSP